MPVTVQPIRLFGDPVLRTTADAVVDFDKELRKLVKDLTQASLPEIGRAFGNKHHTTVIHSIRKIEELRKSDPELNKTINSLIDTLQ